MQEEKKLDGNGYIIPIIDTTYHRDVLQPWRNTYHDYDFQKKDVFLDSGPAKGNLGLTPWINGEMD